MDTKQLEVFAKEAAKSIRSESDLNDFRKMLSKVAIETALNAELEHLWGLENTPRVRLETAEMAPQPSSSQQKTAPLK